MSAPVEVLAAAWCRRMKGVVVAPVPPPLFDAVEFSPATKPADEIARLIAGWVLFADTAGAAALAATADELGDLIGVSAVEAMEAITGLRATGWIVIASPPTARRLYLAVGPTMRRAVSIYRATRRAGG